MTINDTPMSAAIAAHSVAAPENVSTANTALPGKDLVRASRAQPRDAPLHETAAQWTFNNRRFDQ